MPDGFDLVADPAPIAALLHFLGSGSELASKLSKLHRQQQKTARAIREYSAELNSLYEDIKRSGHTADWILEAAAIIRRRELMERERLGPELDSLRQKLRERPDLEDAEGREILEQSVAIGEAWVALPAELHKRLLKLAEERRSLATTIRRAQPMQGEMQSQELTRKIIARFPKILAELAK
jgi:hypothetical protein